MESPNSPATQIPDYKCGNCKEMGATYGTKVKVAPKYLVIHVNNPGEMSFPPNLDLEPFLADHQEEAKFELMSVVVHRAISETSG